MAVGCSLNYLACVLGSTLLHSKLNWAHRSTQPEHAAGRREENKPQEAGVETTERRGQAGGGAVCRLTGRPLNERTNWSDQLHTSWRHRHFNFCFINTGKAQSYSSWILWWVYLGDWTVKITVKDKRTNGSYVIVVIKPDIHRGSNALRCYALSSTTFQVKRRLQQQSSVFVSQLELNCVLAKCSHTSSSLVRKKRVLLHVWQISLTTLCCDFGFVFHHLRSSLPRGQSHLLIV